MMIQVGFKGGALKKQGAYSKIVSNGEKTASAAGNEFKIQERARQYCVRGEAEKSITDDINSVHGKTAKSDLR